MAKRGRPRSFDQAEVVERAKQLFWNRGYAATSLRDLTDELDVLPGSLYAAYGDKHTLFLKALESYIADMRSATAALTLSRIEELLHGVVAAARAHPGRGCMLGNTATELLPEDSEAMKLVQRAFRMLERAVEQGLIGARNTGQIRADVDCAAQARLLVALIQGLHVLARSESDPRRLEDVVHTALASLVPRPKRTPR